MRPIEDNMGNIDSGVTGGHPQFFKRRRKESVWKRLEKLC